MKKSILAVAGVAALAGVVAPVAGVFAATDPISDTITVEIGSNCAFSRTTAGTFSENMTVSDLKDFGSNASTYKVVCNNSKGYTVTASFDGMTSTDTTDTIPYSTTNPSKGTSAWSAYQDSGSTPIASGTKTLDKTAATTSTGDTFTMKYKVSTDDVQQQGTYTGTATYTFAEN